MTIFVAYNPGPPDERLLLLTPRMPGLLSFYTLNDFRKILMRAQNLVIITGAGISAGAGIPTVRDKKNVWRRKSIQTLLTANNFKEDPATVWEYYHHQRELMLNKTPSAAHIAIAECEKWFHEEGRNVTVITQNLDGLHQKAGSKNVMEMHGSLYRTRCTRCGKIEKNYDSPICEALREREKLINETFTKSDIPVKKLPHCKKCGGLLRPDVVFFCEHLDEKLSAEALSILDRSDLAMIIGTSTLVFPVAMYGARLVKKGVPVAEFNIKKGDYAKSYRFFFGGDANETVPDALNRNWEKNGDSRELWEYDSFKTEEISSFSPSSSNSSSSSSSIRSEDEYFSSSPSEETESSNSDFRNSLSSVPSDLY